MKKVLSLLGLGLLALVAANNAEAAQCSAELTNPRGRVLEQVIGNGYTRQEACRQALRGCERVKLNGRYDHRAHRLTCNVVRPLVVRTCSARAQILGRRIRVFSAQSRGLQGSGVKADACQKALRQCVSAIPQVRGSRLVRCVADNGAVASRGGVVVTRPAPAPGRVIVRPPARRHIDPTPTPPRRRGGVRGARH